MVFDVSPFSLVVADAELVDDVAYEVVGLITGPTNTNQWWTNFLPYLAQIISCVSFVVK